MPALPALQLPNLDFHVVQSPLPIFLLILYRICAYEVNTLSKYISSFALIKMLVEFILQMNITSLGLLYLVFQLPNF